MPNLLLEFERAAPAPPPPALIRPHPILLASYNSLIEPLFPTTSYATAGPPAPQIAF